MPRRQRDRQTTGPCTASCSLLIDSAGNHPPGGLRTGSAGVHAGFRLGICEAVDGCPPLEAVLPPVGHWWLSSP